MGRLGMGGGGGLKLYRACNGGPGVVRNVPNPAHTVADLNKFDIHRSRPIINSYVTFFFLQRT